MNKFIQISMVLVLLMVLWFGFKTLKESSRTPWERATCLILKEKGSISINYNCK